MKRGQRRGNPLVALALKRMRTITRKKGLGVEWQCAKKIHLNDIVPILRVSAKNRSGGENYDDGRTPLLKGEPSWNEYELLSSQCP